MNGGGGQLGIDWVMRACSLWTGADFEAALFFWAVRLRWN